MTEVVLDTSVAVPLLVTSHVAHRSVSASLGERAAALVAHAFHETYAVLARLPGDARVAPEDAVRLLRERFGSAAVLDARSVRSAPAVLVAGGVSGQATYDGLVVLGARAAGLPLATRDWRARSTYRLLDAPVEMLGYPDFAITGRTVIDELKVRCWTCHRARHRGTVPGGVT